MATAQLGSLLRYVHKLAAGRGSLQRTDRELLDDFSARRDEAAFAALVARHGPMVLRVCRRVLNHEQDAEDAFQATFLILVRKSGSIRKCDALGAWLHGVAYRTAMEVKRSAARRRDHEARLWTVMRKAAVSPTWDDVQAVLDEEIQRLPETYRAAFVLCVLEGKRVPQAAVELGVKEGTMWTRLTRARQLLQHRLTRRGIKLAAALAALTVGSAAQAGLPAVLAKVTVRFGLLVAAGSPAAGVIPSHVAALAAGVTRAMLVTKTKVTVAVLFAVGLFAAGAGALAHRALAVGETLTESQKSEARSQKAEAGSDASKLRAAEDKDSVTCSGRVVDPDGKPVAGAKVIYARALLARGERPLSQQHPQATADADGRFQLQVATTGYRNEEEKQYWLAGALIAKAKGQPPGWVNVHKAEMFTNVTIKLVKDVPITGRVVDLEGKPIAGATVRVRSLAANDAEDLKLWVEALQKKKEIWGIHYPRTSLDAILPDLPRSATTDADGKFRLAGFGRERLVGLRFERPAIETVEVYALTRPAPTIEVPRQKDEPRFGSYVFHGASFDHAAAPCTPIVGVVRDKDTQKPLAGITILARVASALGSTDEEHYLRTKTDQNGRYRLTGLAKSEEQVILALAAPPYLNSLKQAGGGTGLAPVTVDFDLKRGVPISGRVTDKASGKPLAGVIVEYFAFVDNPNLRDAPGFPSSSHGGAKSSKDGSFTIAGLPGRGLLAAKASDGQEQRYLMGAGAAEIPGQERGRFRTQPTICHAPLFNTVVEITPAKGADLFVQDISLDPGKTVRGKIVDPDGKPIEGTSIDGVWGMDMQIQNLRTAEFRLPPIDPKHPKPFFFKHDDKKLGAAVLFKGDEKLPVTVRLEKCGTLTGRLVDEDGQPRAGVVLTGNIFEGQLNITEGWFGFIGGQTDKDGRFRIDGVLPGVKVGLSTQKGAIITGRLVEELTLKPGETKDLGDVKESK